MPKKIRELKSMLRRSGWIMLPGGKSNHTKWQHPNVARTVIVSGADGHDARPKQERDIAIAIREAQEA